MGAGLRDGPGVLSDPIDAAEPMADVPAAELIPGSSLLLMLTGTNKFLIASRLSRHSRSYRTPDWKALPLPSITVPIFSPPDRRLDHILNISNVDAVTGNGCPIDIDIQKEPSLVRSA